MDSSSDLFDYIVVGAGSAGCVLANRLSADPGARVLLLEAGGRDRSPWIHIPVGYARTFHDKRINWGFSTEPVPGIKNRQIYWPRGKVLGGSSSVNGLLYVRGQAEDFDHWRQLGNAGWAWSDVLPYFRRHEDQAHGADEWHGSGGELAVSDLTERHELCEAYIAAAQQAGLPLNRDFNGASQEGVGYYQINTRNGLRCSAAVAFLKPIRGRRNLSIVTDALVERVNLDGRRAAGITYRQGGRSVVARARREVILAAGAINSPKLLMLSGIGPGEHLRAHGVGVTADLPGVGENLQDHYQVRMIYRCTRPITLNDDLRRLHRKAWIGLQYLLFRRGPMTISAGQAGAFARTRPELASPDVQYLFLTLSTDRPGLSLHDFSGFTVAAYQLRPESRGILQLRGPGAEEDPLIHPNYLATPLDRQTIVDAMLLNREIFTRPAMRSYVDAELRPGPDARSDDELLAYAQETGGTIFHPVGTCKMGPGGDRMAVVDEQLRVRGIEGLRVADASIMPTIVSGNTNAAAIMIGDKAADLVLGRT